MIADDSEIVVDRTKQVLELSVSALAGERVTARLEPAGNFVSATVLAMKAKQFDDGLYATVEIMAHRGKRDLVQKLIKALDAGAATTALLGGARIVAGEELDEPLRSRAKTIVQGFLADDVRSKPIGFYTWSEELRRIFRHDRLLQQDIAGHEDVPAVARVIHADRDVRAKYESALRLAERLTNRLAAPDLRQWLRALDAGARFERPQELALLPASAAHETDLVKKLYGEEPIPPGFDLMNELIARIRSGTVDLAPTESSGWYDWQTWSLETLIAPERAAENEKLHLDDEYRQHLIEMFKGALSLTRETHIKQLEIPLTTAGWAPRPAGALYWPRLRVEPLVTYYTRRAEGYTFVRRVLDEVFGAGALDTERRMREHGTAEISLGEELAWMECLFRGAASAAEQDLGMRSAGDVSTFTTWASTLKNDIDLEQDARAMVPVFVDVQRKQVKAWLFMGWTREVMTASFRVPPDVTYIDGRKPEFAFTAIFFDMATPVMREAYVSRILDRDEFRRLCDLHGTPEAIIEALQ